MNQSEVSTWAGNLPVTDDQNSLKILMDYTDDVDIVFAEGFILVAVTVPMHVAVNSSL